MSEYSSTILITISINATNLQMLIVWRKSVDDIWALLFWRQQSTDSYYNLWALAWQNKSPYIWVNRGRYLCRYGVIQIHGMRLIKSIVYTCWHYSDVYVECNGIKNIVYTCWHYSDVYVECSGIKSIVYTCWHHNDVYVECNGIMFPWNSIISPTVFIN